MKATFAQVNIGETFTYRDVKFVKVETVYLNDSCCLPEYNAYVADNPDQKVCMPCQMVVERNMEPES